MSIQPVPSISVVIPTANRHSTIGRAVDSIYKNTIAPYEVIIVDQSSNDLTLDALHPLIDNQQLIYIRDSGKGISRGRNVGWQKAAGTIIAFTDDDAWVDPKWLECILATFQTDRFNIGAVGGKILPVYEEKNPEWNFPKKWEHLLPSCDHGEFTDLFNKDTFPIGVNLITYRHLLEKLDGFDERMGVNISRNLQILGEDVDYYIRLKRSGFDLVYSPDCIVYHPVPLSRQSQGFLNKRLMYEGATYAYRGIKDGELVALNCLRSLFKSFVKYCLLILSKGNQEDAHYLYGKMLILLKVGIFQIQH